MSGADLVVAEHVRHLLKEFEGDREAAAKYADERAATARFGTGPVWRDVARTLRISEATTYEELYRKD